MEQLINNQTEILSKEKRCTGHCCRRFAMEQSYEEIQKEYAQWKVDPLLSVIPDIQMIAEMVIPIRSSKRFSEHVYRCRNLDSQGNCQIYEKRPQMCRDFPVSKGCHFFRCTSDQSAYHGKNIFQKIVIRWKWLKSLGKAEK